MDDVESGRYALLAAMAACRRAFAHVGGFSFGINLLMLVAPLYMTQVYDRVLSTRHVDTLWALTLIAAAALLTFFGLDAVRGVIVARLSSWLNERLSGPVLAGAVADAGRRGRGPAAQGLRDLGTLRSFLAGPAIFPLFDAPWALVFLAIVFAMHPLLGWISAAGMALLVVLAAVNQRLTGRTLQDAHMEGARAVAGADAAMRNADSLLAMGMLSDFVRHWQDGSARTQDAQLAAAGSAAILNAGARLVRMSLQIALLAAGAWLVIQQDITAGAMFAASVMMSRAAAPAEQAMLTWRAYVTARAAYKRLVSLLQQAPMEADSTDLPKPKGYLAVDRLTFRAPDLPEPLLKSLTFALNPGEALAIIGPSGSGKSTLARLLVGSLKAAGGTVRLDGADVAAWSSADRRRYLGYLPQDIELFSATVRENIARFSQAGDDGIVEAAQIAGAHELILGLAHGYATRIGPGGVPLSGGQRQRIGLARAMFGNPQLIVLDEPNAHLDRDGEDALIEAIGRIRSRGATLILSTQRTGILSHMDKILMLRGGVIEMFGPREEILVRLRAPRTGAARGALRSVVGVEAGKSVEARTS